MVIRLKRPLTRYDMLLPSEDCVEELFHLVSREVRVVMQHAGSLPFALLSL